MTSAAAARCLVLFTSECLAIKGGPDYGGGQGVVTTGIYAGLLVPSKMGEDSLTLFTLTIPRTGTGTGTTAIFRAGFFYSETIQGLADPDSAILTGVLKAIHTQVIMSRSNSSGTVTIVSETFNDVANGEINGKIVRNPNIFSIASARLIGAASITYTSDQSRLNPPSPEIVPYTLIGFKQADG